MRDQTTTEQSGAEAATWSGLSPEVLVELRELLAQARRTLLRERGAVAEDLCGIEQTREAELEERSQEEAAADVLRRLEERGYAEIRDIQAALARIEAGTYGICSECGERIGVARLRALPAASSCVDCVSARAGRPRPRAPERKEMEEETASGPIPPQLRGLEDMEIARLVRESFREQVGDALDAVRIVCRHGLVTLAGEVTSDELRQIARRIVEEELGLKTVDRIRVTRLPGSQAAVEQASEAVLPSLEGDQPTQAALAGGESAEDVFEVEEEGSGYMPPTRPVAESE